MKNRFEIKLLTIFILFEFFYQIAKLFSDLFILNVPAFGLTEKIFFALAYLLLYYLLKTTDNLNFVTTLSYVISTLSLGLEWILYGGMRSSTPYQALLIIVIIVITSNKYTLTFSILIFWSVLALLLTIEQNFEWNIVQYEYTPPNYWLNIDFIIHFTLFYYLILLLKDEFEAYRYKILDNIKETAQIDAELSAQNEEIALFHEEIIAMNQNLERRIEEKIVLIREKNEVLSEYAFINAHLLRGPLCRVLGLLNLMKREGKVESKKIKRVKKQIKNIDSIISEINQIVD